MDAKDTNGCHKEAGKDIVEPFEDEPFRLRPVIGIVHDRPIVASLLLLLQWRGKVVVLLNSQQSKGDDDRHGNNDGV